MINKITKKVNKILVITHPFEAPEQNRKHFNNIFQFCLENRRFISDE